MNKADSLLVLLPLLFVLLLGSCSSTNCRPDMRVRIHGPMVGIYPGVNLIMPRDIRKTERMLLVSAAKIHTKKFIAHWGGLRPVNVYVFRGTSVPCGTHRPRTGFVTIGCHHGPNGPIHLIMGKSYELPALYHEYVHHMINGGDGKHKNPKWSYWDKENENINKSIKRSRSRINMHGVIYGYYD